MAVRIRMKRVGAKNKPVFRIVVADGRSPRDGKFLEELAVSWAAPIGHHNAEHGLVLGSDPFHANSNCHKSSFRSTVALFHAIPRVKGSSQKRKPEPSCPSPAWQALFFTFLAQTLLAQIHYLWLCESCSNADIRPYTSSPRSRQHAGTAPYLFGSSSTRAASANGRVDFLP